ncbi:MAG: hypothetical protein K2L87_00375 [Clostridiales bacterium]|nr:hypothetical protein [Clostridiales bacterium]
MDQRQDEEKDEFFDFPAAEPPSPLNGTSGKQADTAKIKRRVLAIVLALVMLAVGFVGGWLGYYYSLDEGFRTFLWAKKMTERNYYQEIDRKKLYEDMIAALESQLDPYSCFYTQKEYEKIIRESEGQNEGYGIAVTEETVGGTAYARLAVVVENSPAQEAKLQKGMYVLAYGNTQDEMQTGGVDALIDFIDNSNGMFYIKCGFDVSGEGAVVAKLVPREYLAAYCYYRDSEMSYAFRGTEKLELIETGNPIEGLPADTAYIRLDEFNGNAADEFQECLKLMHQRGRSNLILDLRSNGGGYLNILTEIAAHLMRNAEGSSPVVATANYKSGKKTAFTADKNDFSAYFSANSRVSILADEGTASASECLIGALIDYRTVGYGDIYLRKDEETGVARSYGKGIMQSSFSSVSGEVMKLTVATVHWPKSGKCIQGVGVTEEDGANAITAPRVWGAEDTFLLEAIGLIAQKSDPVT